MSRASFPLEAPWHLPERVCVRERAGVDTGPMTPAIDPRVGEVLEVYHQRMEAERPRMRRAMEEGMFGKIIDELLLPVGPASGQLINILIKSLKAPTILELGTSYGYSGIWLAEAARASGGRVVTVDLSAEKSAYAQEMSKKAGLSAFVDFKVGDALKIIAELPHGIDFVLVDLWKNLYLPCFEAFLPKLNPGAIVVSDNMIEPASEREAVMRYQHAVRATPKMSSVLVPGGSGLEISRFEG
jgi:predicted O-methyltransferase YrrM